MVNHGGSPPNLGLKEATPELGETRFNQDILKQHHNNMNHHEYNNLTTHLQSPTKACTMIHKWNHKHWVKVGSPKRRMPYTYALTQKLAIAMSSTRPSRITCHPRLSIFTCHPRLSIFTCLNKAIHTCSFQISSLIPPIEQ